ncbi:MAG: CgeB family protein, partial [Thermoleophilaceae bacterium]
PREAAEPDSSGRLRVAAVLDEVSAACFAFDCELVQLSPEGWEEQLDELAPHFLLAESAWAAKRPDFAALRVLSALTDECRKRDIPTVFWNTEDPTEFERFLEAASRFDHVFTVDAGCVPRYRELGGFRSVAALPFAAQPRLHNPAAVVEARSMSPCFAGAWYGDRHPDARRHLEDLLDAARPYGLVIYDRPDGPEEPAPGFPERFQPHIVGQLPYERLVDVYKSHEVFLNANPVLDSPTMCSRRALELAGCGTAVLSTPAKALAALLDGAIPEAATREEASAELVRLLADRSYRERLTRSARRRVFARHTYRHRLAEIAAAVGVPFDPGAETRVAGLVFLDDEAGDLGGLTAMLAAQSRPLDELVLATSVAATLDPAAIERTLRGPKVRLSRHDDLAAATFGDLAAHASTPWLICPDLDCSYSSFLIEDLQAAATFAAADVIGSVPGEPGEPVVQHTPVAAVHPHGAVARRDVVSARDWPRPGTDDGWARLREWSAEGLAIYATDADLIAGSERGSLPPAS